MIAVRFLGQLAVPTEHLVAAIAIVALAAVAIAALHRRREVPRDH